MSVRKLCACTRIAALMLAAAAFESAAAQATGTTTASPRRQQSARPPTPAESAQTKARADSIVRATQTTNHLWVDSVARDIGIDSAHLHGADSVAAAARARQDSTLTPSAPPAAPTVAPAADPLAHDHQQAVDSMSGSRGGTRAPDTASPLPLLIAGGFLAFGAGLLFLRRARA